MTILITGFAPFGEWEVNSSWEAARLAAAAVGPTCRAELLPVDHLAARDCIVKLLDRLRPGVCLLSGLAKGETLRLETRARKPAELGHLDGPEEIAADWPCAETEALLRGAGFPTQLSRDAGQYVCESTYWTALNYRREAVADCRLVFLHVPPLSDDWPAARIAEAMAIGTRSVQVFSTVIPSEDSRPATSSS